MESIARVSSKNWPINPEGAWPYAILSDNFLKEAFFSTLPRRAECSALVVRKALKAFLKRALPNYKKLNSGSVLEPTFDQDRKLIRTVCDNPRARSRLAELTLQKESVSPRFGRPRTSIATTRPNQDIASLLWTCIMDDPANDETARWVKAICGASDETDAPYFLTVDRLQEAGLEENWPCNADSELFARIVVLMGSKLSTEAALALFKEAADRGSPYFQVFDNGKPSGATTHDTAPQTAFYRPRLKELEGNDGGHLDLPDFSVETKEILGAFEKSSQALSEAAEELRRSHHVDLSDLANAEDLTFDECMTVLQRYRSRRKEHLKTTAEVIDRTGYLEAQVKETIGVPPSLSLSTYCSVAERIKASDLALSLASIGASSPTVLHDWRENLMDGCAGIADLKYLAEAVVKEKQNREARATFVADLITFVQNEAASTSDVRWINELERDEVIALCTEINEQKWLPLKAILLRLITERDFSSSGVIENILYSNTSQQRRELLRFCDSTTSTFDGSPAVKRLVALERFRDALVFGPLAQVSDPAVGLSDVRTVGKTVFDLSVMLTEHLDLVNNADDIRHLLSNANGPKEAFNAFIEFAKTPVTMNGIYKRLREAARNQIFLPLCATEEPSLQAISEALSGLCSGQALENIVSLVSREVTLHNIEARHREQLERYLDQGATLLRRLQAGQSRDTNPRRSSLRTGIRKLIKQLRTDGVFGSLEWFESEIRCALLEANLPDQPTLLGDALPFFDREWSEQDSQWARLYVELPELYDDAKITGLEASSVFLWWFARGELPSRNLIARTLIEAGRYASALSAIDDFGDIPGRGDLLSRLHDETIPQQVEARSRLVTLRERCKAAGISNDSAFAMMEGEINDLQFDKVREQADLLELGLIDAEALMRVETEDKADHGKRDRLTKLLLKAGVTFEEKTPLYDLQMRWADELKGRAPNRTHILLAETVLANVRNIAFDVAADIQSFRDQTEDPATWLPTSVAELFSEMLEPSVFKLRTWIDSYPVFSSAAQDALVRLLRWYLKFFLENAVTLNASGDEPIDGPLERVFEVSEIIGTSAEPISCVAKLTEIGEVLLSEVLDDVAGLDSAESEIEVNPPVADETPAGTEQAGISPSAPVLSELGNAILNDNWSQVLDAVAGAPHWEDADKFAELARLMLVQAQGAGGAISSEVAELASLISSDNMRFVPRATRMDIACRLIAVALEVTKKSEGVPWSEALGQRSDAVKTISGLSGINRRTVENLMKGNLGQELAERLWETATNTAEPQTIRTPLLLWLYERCSPELVLKLAQKHEPTLRERLEQLFEIRSVAVSRPDLVPVAQSLAAQISQQAKTAPFRNFVRGLPSTHIVEQPKLIVTTDEQISPRLQNGDVLNVDLPLTIEPRGLVPEVLSVTLFQDDDVTFADGTRRTDLTKQPLYFASDYLVRIRLGSSWTKSATEPGRELLRLRVGAKTLTGDVIQTDVACQVFQRDRSKSSGHSLDNTSLWDIYPGVGNQPARDDEFIGRVAELEQLRTVLVSAKKPTPVLLTGMRRVGKTSLLHELHKSYKQPNRPDAVTVYLSLAEKRAAFKDKGKDVSATVFSSIVKALAKRISTTDPNNEVVTRLKSKIGYDWHTARKQLQACYDQESFADSLVYLSEKLLEWMGGACKRVIYLVDEAETLVVPYQEGGIKRAELEQFLQSLREISQSSECVGIVLSGSNHIDVFAREYKNAFFGSCLPIDLKGLEDMTDCEHIIAPQRVRPYVQFDRGAVEYAAKISAGMPLFMWQLGAATAALVRSGPARRTDVRRAVQALVLDDASLPFKAYEVLEPLEHMLGLRPQPEPDLLWMLLYRLAQSTSLVAPEANIGFILDQTLLSMRDKDVWRQYLVSLTEIGILEIPRTGEYRFKIPIFAEGFRAPKQWSEFTLRHQRATI